MPAVPIATNAQVSRASSPVLVTTIVPPCTAAVPSYGPNCAAKTPDEIVAASHTPTMAALVLKDGSILQGHSFGAETKSISGECVFQTGTFLSFLPIPRLDLC
ncbi:Carbamoyl-phosphate synthase [Coemansia sp. RSA 2598]|nr:Carbamoyl-phosphate synthase [Coemansia sp. RSA 2598]